MQEKDSAVIWTDVKQFKQEHSAQGSFYTLLLEHPLNLTDGWMTLFDYKTRKLERQSRPVFYNKKWCGNALINCDVCIVSYCRDQNVLWTVIRDLFRFTSSWKHFNLIVFVRLWLSVSHQIYRSRRWNYIMFLKWLKWCHVTSHSCDTPQHGNGMMEIYKYNNVEMSCDSKCRPAFFKWCDL